VLEELTIERVRSYFALCGTCIIVGGTVTSGR